MLLPLILLFSLPSSGGRAPEKIPVEPMHRANAQIWQGLCERICEEKKAFKDLERSYGRLFNHGMAGEGGDPARY